ncbi:MAG: hypothetical protein M3066_21485 [Actinomycetota bacterium]|nr:hypothetical protein [Actinomycetota bacterium]
MAAAESQDQRSWWQSLDPPLTLASSATAEGPVPWPDPIDLGDDPRPANVDAADLDEPPPAAPAAVGEAEPVPGPVDTAAGGGRIEEPGEVGGSHAEEDRPDGGGGWSPALWAPGPVVNDIPGPADVPDIPPLYAEHEVPLSPKGWYGAFAGRSTNTVLVGALTVMGLVLVAVLLVVRSGSDPTQSAQARPGADTVANGDDPAPATTSTATTLPAVDPTTPVPVAASVDQPGAAAPVTGTTPSATTPTATTPTRSTSPSPPAAATASTEPPAPAPVPTDPPAPAPEPTTSPPPPAMTATTAPPPVVATTLPPATTSVPTPTFTIPTIPPMTRPTVPTNPRR